MRMRVDGIVGHVLVEDSSPWIVVRRLDGLGALEERRRPLVRVAADEAVEVFEAQPVGQRSNGPAWLVCQSGTLWFLPYQAVL